jgi:hypothetical protein
MNNSAHDFTTITHGFTTITQHGLHKNKVGIHENMEIVWTYMLVRHAVYAKICTSV